MCFLWRNNRYANTLLHMVHRKNIECKYTVLLQTPLVSKQTHNHQRYGNGTHFQTVFSLKVRQENRHFSPKTVFSWIFFLFWRAPFLRERDFDIKVLPRSSSQQSVTFLSQHMPMICDSTETSATSASQRCTGQQGEKQLQAQSDVKRCHLVRADKDPEERGQL